MSEEKVNVSLLGRTARKMVAVANRVPRLSRMSGREIEETRERFYEKEKPWRCPEHLENTVIGMGEFTMELLRTASAKEEMSTQEKVESSAEEDDPEGAATDDPAAEQEKKTEAAILKKLLERISGREEYREDPRAEGRGIILQLHGGGYYGKFHNLYRHTAAMYHEVSGGLDVLSVDYRVAPEHPHPAALEDALKAYEWILAQAYDTDYVFVAGDSAGGGLALALCLYLRDHGMPLPAGIVTMI